MAFTHKEQRSYWKKNRDGAFELLGNSCVICDRSDKVMVFHRIDGERHANTDTAKLVIAEPWKFTVLCKYPCHVSVHWCMIYLNMKWKDILERLPSGRVHLGYKRGIHRR